MKLEVGKYYKSDIGRKWECVHDFGESTDGRFLCVSEDFDNTYEGRFTEIGEDYDYDNAENLISEWVGPVEHEVEVYFYKYPSGRIGCSNTWVGNEGRNIPDYAIAKIKVKFTEGEGL